VSARPLVPVDAKVGDWPRRVANAVNALTNKATDLLISTEGALTAGQRMIHFKLPRSFAINPSGHLGDAGTAATSNAVFNIKAGGSIIGTATFAAGATTATFAFTSTTVAALALFEIYAPAVADATLANVEILLSITKG
jgi:hypothetical protein